MKRTGTFWVLGGDLRQEKLAALLSEDGHSVHTYALDRAAPHDGVTVETTLEGLSKADCVVLPLPVAGKPGVLSAPLGDVERPLADIFSRLSPAQFLCGGMVGEETAELAGEYGLSVHDYFRREELAIANAVPTAEGAVQIALEELAVTLHGARALVLGYGRVGKLTAHRLAALGAQVTVAARSYEALAWAEAYGHAAQQLTELEGYLCGYDLVVNTIPRRVLNRALLEELKEGCLVIDLASKPGGAGLSFGVWAEKTPSPL